MEAFAVPAKVVLGLQDSGKRKQRPPESGGNLSQRQAMLDHMLQQRSTT